MLLVWFGRIAGYRTVVDEVQPAILGAVQAVTVVLKLVLVPGDARPLDEGELHARELVRYRQARPQSMGSGPAGREHSAVGRLVRSLTV